jgi:hypothetical protein|nr:MAG TPA: hypothetical protein [Caudoviricetes sp.]
MIEKIQVTDSSVIGQIRDSLPTATSQGKGLMPIITEKSPFQQYIKLDNGLEMKFEYTYGMVLIWSMQMGYSAILLLGVTTVKIVSEMRNDILSTVKDTTNRINVYKSSEYVFVVQNNIDDQFRFYINYL